MAREAIWLRAVESGDTTVRDLSRLTGLSVRRVQARLQRARENRVIEEHASGDLDSFDYPYMELSNDPSGNHPWCIPDGTSSEDRGTYHVGGRVRSLRGGKVARDEDLTDDRTTATSYNPDPDGLRGGVG